MMKKTFLFLLIPFLFVQCKSSLQLDNMIPEKYVDIISTKSLKEKLYKISSDEFEGRKTGEKGQKMAAEYLKTFYEKNGIEAPDGNYFQTIPSSFFKGRYKDSENVMAMIKGSEFPDEVVVVSAHYDHLGMDENGEIFNGADDDGSGTVAVMQMAQAFKKAQEKGHGPKRTVLFLHFTGEEIGLMGSNYYTTNPIFPLKNTVANLNIDMIGRTDHFHTNGNPYIYLVGSDRLSSEMDSVVNRQNRKYTKLNLNYKYNDERDPERLYYRSDHYNFAKHGIPVTFFFSGLHDDYHKITDTADKIDYDLLSLRTKLIFYTAWEIANREHRLEVDKK